MVKFKDFSRPLSEFQVLFKAFFLIYFQGLQDSPVHSGLQDSSVHSSTFQACANPGKCCLLQIFGIILTIKDAVKRTYDCTVSSSNALTRCVSLFQKNELKMWVLFLSSALNFSANKYLKTKHTLHILSDH